MLEDMSVADAYDFVMIEKGIKYDFIVKKTKYRFSNTIKSLLEDLFTLVMAIRVHEERETVMNDFISNFSEFHYNYELRYRRKKDEELCLDFHLNVSDIMTTSLRDSIESYKLHNDFFYIQANDVFFKTMREHTDEIFKAMVDFVTFPYVWDKSSWGEIGKIRALADKLVLAYRDAESLI